MTLCDRCRGACCEEAELTLTPADFFAVEWVRARFGDRVLSQGPSAEQGRVDLVVRLEDRCPELTVDGLCAVHGDDQPTACRLFEAGGPGCLEVVKRRRPMLAEDLERERMEAHPCYPE